MRRSRTIAMWLLTTLCISATPIHAQVLDRIRTFAREPNLGRPAETEPECDADKDRRKSRRSSASDFLDNRIGAGIGTVVVGVFTAPYWGPRVMAGDEGGAPLFPGVPGAWDVNSVWATSGRGPHQLGAWSTQFSFDYLTDFDDLFAVGGRLVMESESRLGLDTTFRLYEENTAVSSDDQLAFGDANIVYRFAQNERLRMRSGVGFNWLDDDEGSEFGFNFTYGGDWFPAPAWIVTTDFDLGRLGNAPLFHMRATVGRQIQQAEIFVGYDRLEVRDARADGLVTGIRWWF